MKKIISILVVVLIMMFAFCSCGDSTNDVTEDVISRGWHNKIDSEYNTPFQMLLNYGSCFVYTFKDEATGVWYISTDEGVTPRLNSDGSLYTE